MEKYGSDRPDESSQSKQLQNIARLVDDHYELERRYLQVVSELDMMKNRMKNLSHDIRSPIGGITGMIDLLIDDDKENVGEPSRELLMIKQSARSIMNLVYGTLAAGDTKKGLNENINVDRLLSSALMEINRLYLPMAENKSVSLSMKTKIDTEVPLLSNFFINLIQVTGNLVANAIKYTPPGGSVDVVFTLDTDDNQSILNMTVSDTGRCMSTDQISSFEQGEPVARSAETDGEESFGIGLQHVKKMVAEDNGLIAVKSEKGEGTVFSLSFPLPGKKLPTVSTSHFIVENGTISHNGYHG